MWIFFYFVNLAAASPWLRHSWSPNYSVLVWTMNGKLITSLNFSRKVDDDDNEDYSDSNPDAGTAPVQDAGI
jgi:hypothetical protein